MRSATSRRPSSPFKTILLVVSTLLIGGVGTVGGLVAAGVDLPFLKKRALDTHGLVAVPMCSQPIPAYTKVTRDYLLDPATGLPKVIYLAPETIAKMGMITDFNQVIGRVVSHEKAADYAFKEADFLPKGTRPGLVAGIPPGKRAVTVDVTKIDGIHALKVGDRLDILSSQSVDMQKVFSQHKSTGSVGPASLQMGVFAQQKQATVRVLVQNGALVSPVATRVVPVASSSMTQGAVTRTKPIQEAVIAVDPEEIAPLTGALAIDEKIICVARSGLPDDPGEASVTPSGVNPAEQIAVVESIVGGKREVMYVAKAPGSVPLISYPTKPARPRVATPKGTASVSGPGMAKVPVR